MKPGAIGALSLALLQAPSAFPIAAPTARLRFVRSVVTRGSGESCAVLDSAVFTHASQALKDLRLLTPHGEIPYAITLSEAIDPDTASAVALRVRNQPGGSSFDLEMPLRPYTDVVLDLQQRNFTLEASVSGKVSLSSKANVPLGTFTLFDLTARHLSRNTVLPLQESAFPYLHVELRGTLLSPGAVRGAQVPPSREAQTLYSDVAEASPHQRDSTTVAVFRVPAHVPVERIRIELAPERAGNFSRIVHVTAHTESPPGLVETVDGSISEISLGKIHERQLSFPAIMGINLQDSAAIEVTIENGSEPPLPISAVKLQMRQRSICFTASSTPVSLFYGDASLSAPRPAANPNQPTQQPATQANLGPEAPNPAFAGHQDARTLSERHPDLLEFLLLAVLGPLGTLLLLRTLRRR